VPKNIQIRNVPDEVHEVYKRRAAEAGQSLQEYLLSELTQRAQTPTIAQVLARAGRRTGSRITSDEVVETIRRHRDAG
jgi:plasmid stability protein